MKTKSKTLCILLIVVLMAGFVVTASACGSTFGIKWDRYLPSAEEYFANADKLGEITPINVELGADVYVGRYGLMTIQLSKEMYGYLPAYDATIGKGDGLVNLSERRIDSNIYVFIGVNADSEMILYDSAGTTLMRAKTYFDVDSESVIRYLDGQAGKYAVVNYLSGLQAFNAYFLINADGTLDATAYNDSQLSATATKVPMPGEPFTTPVTPLESMLGKNLQEDEFVDGTSVKTFNNTVVFYNAKGKEMSRWTVPQNIAGAPIYIDKYLIYGTLSQVDIVNTKDYNYVSSSGDKYNYQLNRYNIKTGKITKINADYVIAESNYGEMYNTRDGKYDLARVGVWRMVDGIAYENNYADIYIINNMGKVGFSRHDSVFGMPAYKLENGNYITDSGNIVNGKNKLQISFGSLSAIRGITEDAFVVESNGLIGSVLFDGKVKIPFAYTAKSALYGNYMFVCDVLGSNYVLNVASGEIKALADITGAEAADITISTDVVPLIVAKNKSGKTYALYTIAGDKIADNAVSDELTFTRYSVGDKNYAIAQITVQNGSAELTSYYKITL